MIYSIRNKNNIYGYLFTNKYDDCYIELKEGLDDYPIFFNSFIQKRKYTINSYWTYKWINERIIPYERANINNILKDNNISHYNELLFLIKAKAKASMDDNYIEEVKYEDIDLNTRKRMNKHIIDFIYLKDKNGLIVFLNNNETKIIKIESTTDNPFLSIFGNEIIFNSKIRYDYLEIDKGITFPLSYNSLINYINENIITSKDINLYFGFTRQYLNDLKKEKRIKSLNNNLYIKNDIKINKNKAKPN